MPPLRRPSEPSPFAALERAFATLTAEPRPLALDGALVAHQHLDQLGKDLSDGVAANARNKIFFTTSPDDARILARHVGPYLTRADLCHLDRYQVACRLVVDGRDTTGFTLATLPAPAVGADHSETLRAAARRRGRDAEARRRERLARRWAPDAGADGETAESVCVPVSVSVSPPMAPRASVTAVSPSFDETPTREDNSVPFRFISPRRRSRFRSGLRRQPAAALVSAALGSAQRRPLAYRAGPLHRLGPRRAPGAHHRPARPALLRAARSRPAAPASTGPPRGARPVPLA